MKIKHKRYEQNPNGTYDAHCGLEQLDVEYISNYWNNVTCKECLDIHHKEINPPKGAIVHKKKIKAADSLCGIVRPEHSSYMWRYVSCPECLKSKPDSSYNWCTEKPKEEKLFNEVTPVGVIKVRDHFNRVIDTKELVDKLKDWFSD